VQVAFAVSVAPDRLIVLLDGFAVIVPPPQVPTWPLGMETTMPDGNVSVNWTPVMEPSNDGVALVPFGLVTVKLKATGVPTLTGEVAKLLVMVGGIRIRIFALTVTPSTVAATPVVSNPDEVAVNVSVAWASSVWILGSGGPDNVP